MPTIEVLGLTPDGTALVYDVAGIEVLVPAPDPDLPRIDVIGYLTYDDPDEPPTAWATSGIPAAEPEAPFSLPEHGLVAHVHVPATTVPTEGAVERLDQ